MTDEIQADKRIQKTLNALRDAFFDLVLSRSYDEISVSDIITKANVGRSTFYQHYKSKDDILATSMHFPLSTLARLVYSQRESSELISLLEHFWENRRFAPRIFSGTARKHVLETHVNLVTKQLELRAKSNTKIASIPINLLAHQIAEAHLTIVTDWLLGKGSCSIELLAKHLDHTSQSLSAGA